MNIVNQMIEEKRIEISVCKNKFHNLKAKSVKSSHDRDQLEVLQATIHRLEDEVDNLKR